MRDSSAMTLHLNHGQALKTIGRQSAIIVQRDSSGKMPGQSCILMPDTAAELLFQVIAGRAERAAV
jgi:hypothetical protein